MADELTGIDPFNYTVDQTIQILSPHLSPEHVQSLRFNEVTGRVLLKTASYDTLKSELDIIPLGRRERIMDVVGSLRRESAAYQEYQLHLAQQTPLPLDEDEDLTEIKPLNLPPTTTDKRKWKRQEPLPLPPRFDEPPSPRFATPSLHPLQLWVDNSPLFIRFPRGDEPLAAYVDADHQLRNVEMLRGETAADSGISVPAAIDPVATDQQSDEIEGPPLLHQEDHAGSKRVTPIQVTPLPRDDEEPVVLEGITGLPSPMSDVGDNLDAGSKRIASADDLGVEYMDISESEPESTSPRLPEEPSGPKRIAPTTIAPTRNLDDEMDISDPEPQPIPPSKKGKGASAKRYYLAPKARKIESLFYDVPPGDDISLDYDGNVQFQVVATATKFPGERRYVGRRICRLLKDNSQILEDFSMGYATGSATGQLVRTVHQGRLRVAIKHYDNPERYLRKYEHLTFTVFDVEHGDVRAHRESTKSLRLPWPSLTKPPTSSASDIQIVRHADEPQVPWPIEINSNDNSIHDYDYLLKWQNIDGADEVLPVFGESDDEGEYDEQTWREYQAEFGPKEKVPTKSRRRVYLTKEEVGEAVEEGIRDVVQRWRVKILPKKEAKDAYRLWRKAKKHRNRNQNIKEARAGIKALNERLDKMKTEFLKSEMNWTSRDMVRKQVKGSTEQTVYDREDLEWIIDLMRRKEQPIKPTPKKKAGASAKEGSEGSAGRADSDDEESVGSSSDDDQFSESDTGMGGFIISDPGELDDDENESDSDSEDEEDEDDVVRPAKRQRPNPEVVDDSDGDSDDDDMGSLSSPRALPQINQQIKAENSPVGERNYIDLTLDESPPRRKAKPRVIDLESDTDRATSPKQLKGKERVQDHQSESRELEQRRKSSGGKLATPVPEVSIRDQRYEVLRSVVHEIHEKGESIKYQAVCCRYRDLDEHTAWFSTIVEGLKCLHKPNPQNLYELEITRNTCRLYIAWLFRRRNATGHDKVTKDELSRLNDFRRFMAFIEDLMHIYNGGELRSESRPPKKVRGGEIPKSGVKKQSKVRSKPEREDYEFDDLDNSQLASTQHRKRKRQQVIEDETAKSRRNKHQNAHKNILRRMQDHERKARKKGEVVEDGKMILNKGHYAKHKDILPHPEYIQEKLKQHQIEGIRFLWTQLVLVGENGGGVGENRGALLAHTMGLGKTLQV